MQVFHVRPSSYGSVFILQVAVFTKFSEIRPDYQKIPNLKSAGDFKIVIFGKFFANFELNYILGENVEEIL